MDAKELAFNTCIAIQKESGQTIPDCSIFFILEAIKKARNDALEEAAKVADKISEMVCDDSDYFAGMINSAGQIAYSIRDLKEK